MKLRKVSSILGGVAILLGVVALVGYFVTGRGNLLSAAVPIVVGVVALLLPVLAKKAPGPKG